MNTKRKADLQRKLSMVSVPTPPEDLASRIKADIPKYLTPEIERRSSRRLLFRIAASLIVIVTSALVAVQVIYRDKMPVTVTSRPSEKAMESPFATPTIPPAPAAETAIQQDSNGVAERALQDAPAGVPAEREVRAAAQRERAEEDQNPASDSFAGVVAQAPAIDAVAPPVVAETSASSVAPPPPPAPTAPPPATAQADTPSIGTATGVVLFESPAPPAKPIAPARTISRSKKTSPAPVPVPASAPSPVPPPAEASVGQRTVAAEAVGVTAQKPRQSVFGISVDPEAFPRLSSEVQSGHRPRAASVNVEAVANYFAMPGTDVRRNVQLEVEGSPSPVGSSSQRGILRFTVDSETRAADAGAAVTPIAVDAHVDIEFNRRAVESFRRLGDDDAKVQPEPMLLLNESVTALYDVQLKPGVSPRTRVATVRLRYRSLSTGRQQTITKELRAHSLAGSWTAASRRHRLASLGAAWAETLKGTGAAADVARKAEELATQEPDDRRARELSSAASASSRLRSSGPTGSGR